MDINIVWNRIYNNCFKKIHSASFRNLPVNVDHSNVSDIYCLNILMYPKYELLKQTKVN